MSDEKPFCLIHIDPLLARIGLNETQARKMDLD